MKGKTGFTTYKRRGEWVELLFMVRAAQRGFNVSKPWGDSSRYDVSVEHEGRFRRVQVKSTDVPRGNGGFICSLKRTGIQYYRIEEVDFFAIYVVRKDAWFVLPAKVVLRLKSNIRVAPGCAKQKYASYEGAWDLLRRRGVRQGRSRPAKDRGGRLPPRSCAPLASRHRRRKIRKAALAGSGQCIQSRQAQPSPG
ncbi:MAG: group I intron-associated PD-(D/E)XK endonuclease [Candidatus Sulfotelmatobacter sp.]